MSETKKNKGKPTSVQGYAFSNDRAFCNCQKQKFEKTGSHWQAWNDCWEEYKEAYNENPDGWIKKYLPLAERTNIKKSERIKNIIKKSFVSDVESIKGNSKYSGSSIRNVLLNYADIELKEQN
jgi:hypothetical protein